ncbi:MAG: hypothetical protein H6811_10320 [Phycisphaeraceae bacterium]|nr:hypothetical protein [Phycisphaeraceae bacterium]
MTKRPYAFVLAALLVLFILIALFSAQAVHETEVYSGRKRTSYRILGHAVGQRATVAEDNPVPPSNAAWVKERMVGLLTGVKTHTRFSGVSTSHYVLQSLATDMGLTPEQASNARLAMANIILDHGRIDLRTQENHIIAQTRHGVDIVVFPLD